MTHFELEYNQADPPRRPPTPCPHQVGKLGTWIEPGPVGKPLRKIGVFLCPACKVVIEVLHVDNPAGMPIMKHLESYPFATAVQLRRSRR